LFNTGSTVVLDYIEELRHKSAVFFSIMNAVRMLSYWIYLVLLSLHI